MEHLCASSVPQLSCLHSFFPHLQETQHLCHFLPLIHNLFWSHLEFPVQCKMPLQCRLSDQIEKTNSVCHPKAKNLWSHAELPFHGMYFLYLRHPESH